MQLTPMGHDLHLRHTGTNGQSYVHCHRVWDVDRFLTVQANAVAKANADARAKNEPAKAAISHITPEQYRTERKAQ